MLAHELERSASYRLTPDRLFDAIETVHERARGAYAVVGLIAGYGVFAFRDPDGTVLEILSGVEHMVR